MFREIRKLIGEGQQLNLEKYNDKERLKKEAIGFTGSARSNKTNPTKIYLRLNPLEQQSTLLEFNIQDILFVEELQTLSQQDGSSFPLIRLWVRKESIGVKLEPFVVQDKMSLFAEA